MRQLKHFPNLPFSSDKLKKNVAEVYNSRLLVVRNAAYVGTSKYLQRFFDAGDETRLFRNFLLAASTRSFLQGTLRIG